MALSSLLVQAHKQLSARAKQLFLQINDQPKKKIVLFFSISGGRRRARVGQVTGGSFPQVWQKGAQLAQRMASRHKVAVRWLRVDWVTTVEPMTWETLNKKHIEKTKRSFFRYGIAFDADFKHAFLEQELNANAMLYRGVRVPSAKFNENNFMRYARRRYGKDVTFDFSAQKPVFKFATQGVFVAADPALRHIPGSGQPHWLSGPGRNGGRRQIRQLTPEQVYTLIVSGSKFLTQQVDKAGKFVYGYFPCFGRKIPTYNTLRHASTIYSMVEAWELTRDQALMAAIERALNYLANEIIRLYPQEDGSVFAFNVDINDEIKLGANAVSILAMVKYTELTGNNQYLSLMESLALGIAHMQDEKTGQFVHILNAADLSVKNEYRTIYYDGEAAFGLMRLYGLTKDPRWLAVVEKGFDYFIANDHWKAHDHWLSYCANELTLYKPKEKYFRFGVKNIADHLDFIINRITTFPTLLELSMAFYNMLDRVKQMPDRVHVLDGFDVDKFYQAMHHRAHYLLNGFFWPEFAMFYARPTQIVGSFFIRHHAFRVRIDDVEHYLSGYVAYWKMLKKEEKKKKAKQGAWLENEKRSQKTLSQAHAPQLSVVIPVYNRADKVGQCLDSIAQQTLDQNRYEVIVVDDYSTDQTVNVVQQYTGIKNLKLMTLQENSGGASKPRNVGMDAAQGDYIVFVDSDDTLTPKALQLALDLALQNHLDMVFIPIHFQQKRKQYTFMFEEYAQGVKQKSLKKNRKLARAVFRNPGIVGRLFHTRYLRQAGLRFSEKLRVYEDTLFARFSYAIFDKVGVLPFDKAGYCPAGSKPGAKNLSRQKRTIERCVTYIAEAIRTCVAMPDTVVSPQNKNRIINNALCRNNIYNTVNHPQGYQALTAISDLLIPLMANPAIRVKAKELIRKTCHMKCRLGQQKQLAHYFQQGPAARELGAFFQKAWVWQEDTLVVNFNFYGYRVGVDISKAVGGYQPVKLVLRGHTRKLDIIWTQFGERRNNHIYLFYHCSKEGWASLLQKITRALKEVKQEISRKINA